MLRLNPIFLPRSILLRQSSSVSRSQPSTKEASLSDQLKFNTKIENVRHDFESQKISRKFTRSLPSRLSPAWLVSKLPGKLNAYARLSRVQNQIGTLLLWFPCATSVALTGLPWETQLYYDAIMLFGAFCMRGAGCIANDLADIKYDQQVKRTKSRPLASGELTKNDAYKSLFAHLLGAAATLPLLISTSPNGIPDLLTGSTSYNLAPLYLALGSLPLVATYPFAKRFTYCPQLVLGATFSIGAFMGHAAATDGNINPAVTIPLYASSVLWTLYYDTIYAFQDIEDDRKIGVKSFPQALMGHQHYEALLKVKKNYQKSEEIHFQKFNVELPNKTKLSIKENADITIEKMELEKRIDTINNIMLAIGLSSSWLMTYAMYSADQFHAATMILWTIYSSMKVIGTSKQDWVKSERMCQTLFEQEKKKGFVILALLILAEMVMRNRDQA